MGSMSTEQEVSPGTETQNPAPEIVEIADVTNPEAVTAEAAETTDAPEAEADDADKALKRMQRRIDKRTADVYRTRAENDQLKARLAELETKPGKADEPQQSADPVVLAKQIAKVERFTEKANALVAEGKTKHSDYMDALKDLGSEVGEFVRPDGLPTPFMEAVLDVAEKPTEMLYYLGKNPDVAADLAELSPYRLGKRLGDIQRNLTEKQTPKLSNAPKPLEPVKARSSDSDLGPGLSDQEWLRRREAQLKAARA